MSSISGNAVGNRLSENSAWSLKFLNPLMYVVYVRVTFGMTRFRRTVILLITKIQHTHRVFIDRGNI